MRRERAGTRRTYRCGHAGIIARPAGPETKGRLLLGADVGAPARDSEHQALLAQQLDRAQDGVPADIVFFLKLLDRRQRPGPPLAIGDLGAQDRSELPVGRLRQSMIHTHKINVGQYRPRLIRGYI
jgi:hypothetical protein